MKRFFMFFIIPALMLSACSNKTERTDTSMQTKETQSQTVPNNETYSADNTGLNKTEKNYSAEQTGNDKTDVQLTADIRKAILKEKNMSVDSQNVKIITNGGNVTLRGPVDSAAEKSCIAELARNTEGVKSVNDEMLLKSKSVATKNGKEIK